MGRVLPPFLGTVGAVYRTRKAVSSGLLGYPRRHAPRGNMLDLPCQYVLDSRSMPWSISGSSGTDLTHNKERHEPGD